MADRRGKDLNWTPLDESGNAPTWERVAIAILLDIRDELKRLNLAIWCPNFTDIPNVLRRIDKNTKGRKKRRAGGGT